MQPPRNSRQDPVAKLCLAMEEFRRSGPGRVRDAKEMVAFFFPHGATEPTDKVFVHMPPEVRAPILTEWKVRGPKAALRDDDAKVRSVVVDAFAAGDIDDAVFETGIAPATMIDWVPLQEWWTFWRGGRVSGAPVQKLLAVGRELALFDDRWFFEHVDGRGGRLKGTDTICDTLTKDQLVAWIRALHESGDGSPGGMVKALGWETILAKASPEALLFAVDALAKKIGLVSAAPESTSKMQGEPPPIDPVAAAPMMSSPVRPSYGFGESFGDEEKTSDHDVPSQ